MKITMALACAFSLVALVLAGCATSAGPEPPTVPEPLERTSPEDVMHNVELAYEEMNASWYLDCFSEDFIFYPTEEDVHDPNLEIPPEWYKLDEREMHENMFGAGTNIERVRLTMTRTDSTYVEGIPQDPSDDVYIYEMDVDLRVSMSNLTFITNHPSQFWMRVDTDQQGTGGEPFWEIYLWYELSGKARGTTSPSEEDATWGGIKALYR